MRFSASSEVNQPAFAASVAVRKAVGPYLDAAFQSSGLAGLECRVRYVPIIMPIGMRERYPARSRLRRRERIYDCAPQLDYDIFVNGTFEQQVAEYLGGIIPSGRHLAAFGASKDQIAEFENIVAGALEHALTQAT